MIQKRAGRAGQWLVALGTIILFS
jgi:hypothetical protein